MLKQVVWIEQTQFICLLVEGIFKEQNVACYTLSDCKDFSYLLNDLAPEVLVCDIKTINNDLVSFKKQVGDYQGHIIATGSRSDFENFKDFPFSGLIEKPLNVETLFDNVVKFVK